MEEDKKYEDQAQHQEEDVTENQEPMRPMQKKIKIQMMMKSKNSKRKLRV